MSTHGKLLLLTALSASWAGCKTVEHERRDFARALVASVSECRAWAGGHHRQSLVVFCESAPEGYVESTVMPKVIAACDDLKRLEFDEVTVYGPRSTQKRWLGRMSEPSCELSMR